MKIIPFQTPGNTDCGVLEASLPPEISADGLRDRPDRISGERKRILGRVHRIADSVIKELESLEEKLVSLSTELGETSIRTRFEEIRLALGILAREGIGGGDTCGELYSEIAKSDHIYQLENVDPDLSLFLRSLLSHIDFAVLPVITPALGSSISFPRQNGLKDGENPIVRQKIAELGTIVHDARELLFMLFLVSSPSAIDVGNVRDDLGEEGRERPENRIRSFLIEIRQLLSAKIADVSLGFAMVQDGDKTSDEFGGEVLSLFQSLGTVFSEYRGEIERTFEFRSLQIQFLSILEYYSAFYEMLLKEEESKGKKKKRKGAKTRSTAEFMKEFEKVMNLFTIMEQRTALLIHELSRSDGGTA